MLFRSELRQPVCGLSQIEPLMRITYVAPNDFNGLMTYIRNILMVDIDEGKYTRLLLCTEKNRWASGQTVVYFTAPNESMLIDYLRLHQGILTDYFTRLEMARMAEVSSTISVEIRLLACFLQIQALGISYFLYFTIH